MQDPFEFNAPKTYQFLAAPRQRDPADFGLNLTDPNDYWFMVTHVEISPKKQQDEDGEETNSMKIVMEPIRRSYNGQRIEERLPEKKE
jgi:hypothetical protein